VILSERPLLRDFSRDETGDFVRETASHFDFSPITREFCPRGFLDSLVFYKK
jgi:hypothetical protein